MRMTAKTPLRRKTLFRVAAGLLILAPWAQGSVFAPSWEGFRVLLAGLQAASLYAQHQLNGPGIEQKLPLSLLSVSPNSLKKQLIAPKLETFNGDATNKPVLFVNGAGIPLALARQEAQALSERLQRPVQLLYNPTRGIALDVVEAAADRFSPVLENPPTFNRTALQIASWLVNSKEPVSIVSHSQGSLLVRNGLLIAHALRPIRNRVAWIATGMPMRPLEIYPEPIRFRSITNPDDRVVPLLVELKFELVHATASLIWGRHDFQENYLHEISADALFSFDSVLDEAQEKAERQWEGVWQAPEPASITFRADGIQVILADRTKIKARLLSPLEMAETPTGAEPVLGQGSLKDGQIHWSNGSVWKRPPIPAR